MNKTYLNCPYNMIKYCVINLVTLVQFSCIFPAVSNTNFDQQYSEENYIKAVAANPLLKTIDLGFSEADVEYKKNIPHYYKQLFTNHSGTHYQEPQRENKKLFPRKRKSNSNKDLKRMQPIIKAITTLFKKKNMKIELDEIKRFKKTSQLKEIRSMLITIKNEDFKKLGIPTPKNIGAMRKLGKNRKLYHEKNNKKFVKLSGT